jgi:transposase-like protein
MATDFRRRQGAIRLRLAGQSVPEICQQLGCSRAGFYTWWQRYQQQGADGLRERSRAPHTSPHQTPDEMRQAIVTIRDRLARRRGAYARYRLAGAATIQHELAVLGYTPLPALRTIERILHQSGRTNPPLRLAPHCASATYPGPQARSSNDLHQLDLIGPRYLKGSHARYYFLVYKDAYDQTPYVEFHRAPKMETLLGFVVRAWQRLGRPRRLQVDNDRRLVLLVGVELVFIPEGEPFRNGTVENFNGWLQERLLAIQLRGPAQVRRELKVLMEVCFKEHIHPHLGFGTPQQVRRGLAVRRLPANFQRHQQPLPVTVGKVTFLRKVRRSGRITVLGVAVRVGRRWKGRYVRATLYTRNATLKIYLAGRLVKQVAYPLRGAG